MVDKLSKDIKRKYPAAVVLREKPFVLNQRKLQPDITWIESKTTKIVEVTVPYETSIQYLESRNVAKRLKYQILLDTGKIQQIDTVVIGALGTVTRGNASTINRLGMITTIKQMQMIAMNESANIAHNHLKSTDF